MSRKCWCCAVAVVTLHNSKDVGWLWMSWCHRAMENHPFEFWIRKSYKLAIPSTATHLQYANPIISTTIIIHPLLSDFSWHIIDAKHPALIIFNCETAQGNPLLASWLILFWWIQLSITIIIHPFLIGYAAIYPWLSDYFGIVHL